MEPGILLIAAGTCMEECLGILTVCHVAAIYEQLIRYKDVLLSQDALSEQRQGQRLQDD